MLDCSTSTTKYTVLVWWKYRLDLIFLIDSDIFFGSKFNQPFKFLLLICNFFIEKDSREKGVDGILCVQKKGKHPFVTSFADVGSSCGVDDHTMVLFIFASARVRAHCVAHKLGASSCTTAFASNCALAFLHGTALCAASALGWMPVLWEEAMLVWPLLIMLLT